MHNKEKILFLLMTFWLAFFMVGCGSESNAEALASYAEEQFMENDYESYLTSLREACELDDLEFTPQVVYSYKYDYEKESKTLFAECRLTFQSDSIDNFYTTEYNGSSSEKLANVLNRLKNAYYKEPTYTYTSPKGTVKLKISNGVSDKFDVITSAGRDYEFSYYVNYDEVHIDGEYVYMEKARNESYTYESNDYSGSYDAKLKYGSGAVLICSSEDAMDRYMTALNNKNQGTIDEMTNNGEIAFTAENTKCNIVDRKLTKAKVNILDGDFAGNTVWVIIESLQEE